ncbi:zinc finger protein 728-like [Centruroides vittatus]|uniref:zinc finger protein 728-like n=1 Tax=Centruroides vittatus TaxID=120091 RepID=UPI00350FF61E
MPRCCSVSGCKTNYRSEKETFSTFCLPKEPLRSIWLQKIPTDLTALKNPIICIKHFDESSIIRIDKCLVKGQLKEFPRKIPKLKEGAIPTIFPNLSNYLSSESNKCKRPEDVGERNLQDAKKHRNLLEYEKYKEDRTITNPQDFAAHYKAHFDADQFEKKIPNKLKPNAIPTLFPHTQQKKPTGYAWKENPFSKSVDLDHTYARRIFIQKSSASSDLHNHAPNVTKESEPVAYNNNSKIVQDLKFKDTSEMIEEREKFNSVEKEQNSNDEDYSADYLHYSDDVRNLQSNNLNRRETRISYDDCSDTHSANTSQTSQNMKALNYNNNSSVDWQNYFSFDDNSFESCENDDSTSDSDYLEYAFKENGTEKGYEEESFDYCDMAYDLKLNSQCKVVCEKLNILREKKHQTNFTDSKNSHSKYEDFKQLPNVKDIFPSYSDSSDIHVKNFAELVQLNLSVFPEKKKNLTNSGMKIEDRLKVENKKGLRKHKDEIYNGTKTPKDRNIYICGVCNAKFFSLSKLTAHKCIDEEEKDFKCKFCQKEFFRRRTFKIHMKIHGGLKHVRCDFCAKRRFTTRALSIQMEYSSAQILRRKILKLCLKRLWIKDINALNSQLEINKDLNIEENSLTPELIFHRETHSEDSSFQCEICNRYFRQKSHLSQHKLYHSNEKLHKCQFCEESFTKRKDLMQHANCHSEEREYKCKICEEGFKKKSHLLIHRRSHFVGKLYNCDICKKTFKHLSNLNCHKRCHSEERPFECEICQQSFKSSLNLTYHKLRHSLERPFECEFCGKRFKGKMHLMRHKSSHSVFKPFQCNICNKKFTSGSNLVTHQIAHSNERPFQCELCKKRFKQKLHLIRHQKSHSNEKSRLCKVCGKDKTEFSDHEKCHYENRRYKCEICEKRFKKSSHLKEHRRCHSSKNPYQCELCHRTFRKKCNLVRHHHYHSDEKPYECEYCGKHFKCIPNLNSHKKCHVKDKCYQCTICNMNFQNLADMEQHVQSHSAEEPLEEEIYEESLKDDTEEEALQNEIYQEISKDGFFESDDPKTESGDVKTQIETPMFQCSYCKKSFEEVMLMLDHERSHYGKPPSPTEKIVQRINSKKRKKGRAEAKLHQCEHCDKSFKFKMHLVRHMRYHLRENLFHCMLCRKTFKSMSNLIDHQSFHIG